MRNILFAILILFAQSAISQIVINSDGSHSVVTGNVIVNSDGSHSIISGNVVVNPNGSHSIIAGNVLLNSNGTHSVFPNNINSNNDYHTNTHNNSVNIGITSKPTIADFAFIIENTKDGVKITDTNGCAFTELSFSINEGETKAIDQYGMRYTHDKRPNRSINATPFIIQIKKTKAGFLLKGIYGVSFRKLSLECPIGNSVGINQNGMI